MKQFFWKISIFSSKFSNEFLVVLLIKKTAIHWSLHLVLMPDGPAAGYIWTGVTLDGPAADEI